MKTEFSKVWNDEVKALAEACIEEPRLVELLKRNESCPPNEEEREYMKTMRQKYKDMYGMYYISQMVDKVEQALSDKHEARAILACCNTYCVLSDEVYFRRVFNSDENSEEWKKREALRDGLKKIADLI